MPDGATVDAEGCVWCAHMFGGRVSRFAPDGTVDRTIALPVPQVTSCAFGGPELATLYVTTASLRMDRAALSAQPLAGAPVRRRSRRARPARAGVRRLSPRRG